MKRTSHLFKNALWRIEIHNAEDGESKNVQKWNFSVPAYYAQWGGS